MDVHFLQLMEKPTQYNNRFEVFVASKCNEIFSSSHLCRQVNIWYFRDCLQNVKPFFCINVTTIQENFRAAV